MKKLVILLLAMVFAISVAAADGAVIKISEDQEEFDLYLTLPENVSIATLETEGEYSITDVEIEGNDMLDVKIVTAPDELYVGKSLADLDEAEVNSIIGWYTEEMSQASVAYQETESKYEYIIINENEDKNDSCETITLVLGYHIMISVSRMDFSELSEDEMAIGSTIMETLLVEEK